MTELASAGISLASITLIPENESFFNLDDGSSYDTAAMTRVSSPPWSDFFLPDEDRSTYAEAMHRGNPW